MGEHSSIEWTDATWTPTRARNRVTGKVGWHCEHASPGCANCYSETFNERRLGTGLPFKPGHRDDVEHFLDEAMLLAPLRWRRPRRIFVCSMTDLFGEWVPDAWIDQVFAVMALAPQHTFQVLTKRSARMRAYMAEPERKRIIAAAVMTISMARMREAGSHEGGIKLEHFSACFKGAGPFPNIWLGVSAEDQRRADERVPDLLVTPAAVRFLSAEPLLGRMGLTVLPRVVSATDRARLGFERVEQFWVNALTGEDGVLMKDGSVRSADAGAMPRLDWVIVGGESGPGARPMHPDWARSLRDQCAAAGVPFHFKQWGAWKDGSDFASDAMAVTLDGRVIEPTPDALHAADRIDPLRGQTMMRRVGKKAAGRLLDGVEHNGMPEHPATGPARREMRS